MRTYIRNVFIAASCPRDLAYGKSNWRGGLPLAFACYLPCLLNESVEEEFCDQLQIVRLENALITIGVSVMGSCSLCEICRAVAMLFFLRERTDGCLIRA